MESEQWTSVPQAFYWRRPEAWGEICKNRGGGTEGFTWQLNCRVWMRFGAVFPQSAGRFMRIFHRWASRFIRRCGRGGDIGGRPRFRRAFTGTKLRDGAALQGWIFEFERRLAGLHRDRKPPPQHRLVDRGRTSGQRRTGGEEGAQERHAGPFAVSGRRISPGCAQRGLQMRCEQFCRQSVKPWRPGQGR